MQTSQPPSGESIAMHETNQGLFPPFIAAKKTRIPPNLQIIVARMNCFTDWDLRKCYLKSVTGQCQQCNPRRLENRLPSNLPVCQIERDTAKEKDVRRIFLGQKHLCIAISSYHSHRVINPPRGLGASNKSNTMAKEASAGQTLRPPKLLGFTGTTAGESSGETMENRRLRRPHQQDPTFQCFGSGARTVEGKTSGLKS